MNNALIAFQSNAMSAWHFEIKYYLLLLVTAVRLNHGASSKASTSNKPEIVQLQDEFVKMVLSATDRRENGTIQTNRLLRQGLSSIFGNFDLAFLKDEISKSVTGHLTCTACNAGLGVVKLALKAGTRESDVGATLLHICATFKIQPEKVCQGLIDAYKDEVFFILSRTPLSSKEICAAAVGAGCGVLSRRQWWVVPLSSKPKPPVTGTSKPQTNSPTSNILHITDTHVDWFYEEGAPADCADPLCCRKDSVAAETPRQAGKWGDFGKCDIPAKTFDHMFQFITKNHKIEYVFWTGDIPPHDVWKQSREEQLSYIQETMTMIQNYFPHTLVLPVMGNHESVPPNSFPPSMPAIPEKYYVTWLYEALLDHWKTWLPKSTHSTILKGGYYSLQIKPGLRVISVNTNFCYNVNWWLLLNIVDPGGQLHWLADNLQDAEDKKEKVYIIGHIPPGGADCMKVWSANFYNIINRYESTVVAQFFGHTHTDEFEVFYDQKNKKRATNVAYVAPSVTTYEGLNPAYRLYKVARDQTHDILDHETYMMDLDEANRVGPSWKKLYSAKESYNLPSLQPQEWSNLVIRMTNNKSLFDQFYRFYHRDSSHYPSCSQSCKKSMLCALKSGRSQDPKLCAA